MRIVVGLGILIGAASACGDAGDGLTTSTTAQAILALPTATHDFGTVQVGQSSAPFQFEIEPGPNATNDTINSITESCPDFSVSATGLPAQVIRICNPNNCTNTNVAGGTSSKVICEPQVAPDIAGCIYGTEEEDDYFFTTTFTPTVAAMVSCVVTITYDSTQTRTVTITGTGNPPPVAIGVSPTSIAFGDVRATSESTAATVTVRDLGGSTLTVSSASVTAGFAYAGPASFQVAPNGATPLQITCDPPGVGPDNGTLTIVSNDPNQGTINVPLTCNGVTSNLLISPSPAAIPDTLVGAPVTQHIDLVNEGGASTTINSVSIDGAGLTMATAVAPGPLGPSASIGLDIAFDAATHGSAMGTLTVVTTDGTRTAAISANALLATLSLSPDGDVDLGPVCAGATATQRFTLVGNGDGGFDLTALALADVQSPFAITAPTLPAPVMAAGGNQVTFTVGVAPTAAGALSTSVDVTTDIPNDVPHTIQLTALGLAPGTTPTPTALDLGSAPLDSTTIGEPILLTNCSAADVPFSNPRIEGSDASEFAIVAQPDGQAIAADASAQWLVVLSARTAGVKSAQFSVDTAAGTTSVPLTGEGLAPGTGSGSDDGSGATGEHNYYSCSAGGAGGAAPIGLGLAIALAARRRRVR